MSTLVDSAAAQLRLCQHHEHRLRRQLDSSESTLAQQKEMLEMHGREVEAVEKSGAADMIGQLDQLAVQEESMDSDIWQPRAATYWQDHTTQRMLRASPTATATIVIMRYNGQQQHRQQRRHGL